MLGGKCRQPGRIFSQQQASHIEAKHTPAGMECRSWGLQMPLNVLLLPLCSLPLPLLSVSRSTSPASVPLCRYSCQALLQDTAPASPTTPPCTHSLAASNSMQLQESPDLTAYSLVCPQSSHPRLGLATSCPSSRSWLNDTSSRKPDHQPSHTVAVSSSGFQ